MRQLILFRHAKTEPFSETGTDETRRLTDRGHEDARLSAQEVKRLGLSPDRVLVSTARRTRETWSEVSAYFSSLSPIYREQLYLADPDEIVSEISRQPDTDCMMVIGHNPGIHELALHLTQNGGTRNEIAASQLRIKFPTGSMAIFQAKENDPFDEYNFELTEFIIPKDLRERGTV